MTALAQGCAGLALVMCFALLRTRQISAAVVLLAVQSLAVAVTAAVLHRPVLAAAPLLLAASVWFIPRRSNALVPGTAPVGGAKLGILAAFTLAVLCQSQGPLGMPLAIVLLSMLLATTRRHPFMHVTALVALGNGLALAACLAPGDPLNPPVLLPLGCLLLPLPLAAGLLLPDLTQRGIRAAGWPGWVDLAVSLAILAATIAAPLDPTATLFAPLLAFDGVLRSIRRRRRQAISLQRRGLALLTSLFLVLAVAAPDPFTAWLAVLGAVTAALLPVLTWRWDQAVLAFQGAGAALLGLLLLTPATATLGFFSLFTGCVAVAGVVPDVAAVLVVIILRLATQAAWPGLVAQVGPCLAVLAVLACAAMLIRTYGRLSGAAARPAPAALLELTQASIAALCIGLNQPDSRFAAVLLLVLLILSRASVRVATGRLSAAAVAGLGGIPPFGVFPGLLVAALAVASAQPWLLLPLGAAAVGVMVASLPRPIAGAPIVGAPIGRAWLSIGWLPLLLAFVIGYAAPDRFVRWCQMLAAGHG